ncbi:hypothetical protein QYE76_065123 [Lolium multiflorum]|uniref:Reverse transcriptase domain-containing protein n=1 Tax=Lolium multiflorum TaxID=4521 RepID=A0AAD8S914_LOLMU|nr:hypothetical protein QYE76_065123 [Lolium multiflorum]
MPASLVAVEPPLRIAMNEVRKKLFTISLSGKAAHWYKLLKNGDSIDWEDIVPLFYSKFYPPSEIHKDRNRIYNFWPHDGESIAQAWGRLKSLMLKCPIHELPGNVIIDNFYARLSFQDKTLLDTSCSGSFTRNKEEFKRDILDRIQENTEGWENDKDRESGVLFISSAVNKSEKKPKEPEEQIKIEPAVAIVKDLVTENVEDGHIIFCEDASNIVSHPNKPNVSAIPYELYTEIMHEIDSCELEDIDVVIQLANRETISPIGIVRDVEVLCGKIKYPADFLQHLENSESEAFRKERDELEEIFLRQPILKHDLPVEDLGTTPPPKEDPVFDLKPLPDNLKYAHIDDKKIYPVIISSKLSEIEEERLLEILKKHRGAIGYTLDDLKGISPSICQHAINMEDDAKPVVEHQRRLIPKMKEVVRNEVLKLLEAGIIYPIADSRWVSPVHCVPKKGGMTVVPNDNDELIPQRVVVGYRMCIDFRKVNKVTKKDHYPLPFIDQMLERLSKNTHFCFLDGYSGFSQIAVKAKDQEKTTFTCPYGTYAYRRMPFGLCNAPATFQRCMSAIFHGFCESIVEVFMDDFSVYGNSFDNCLRNLDKVLQRCEETNLVLNWEKCHFMVNEGIVLGHKISERGIEVDRAKVEAIEKMPYPRDVKGIRSVLGHAGFYRRFIKDFSKISKPLTNLLQKDRSSLQFLFGKSTTTATVVDEAPGISMNEVRKKLFTISLSGKAAHWYKLLKNGDSIDWEDIVPLFYSKFYPPSEIHKDRNRIYNFWPHDGESIAQAWGRLKSLMLKCPIHELPGNVIIDNFYARLSFQDKTLLDTSCSGSFTRKNEEFKRDLLDRIQENTEGWENDKDRESGIIYDYKCIETFMDTDKFRNMSATYGLDSQVVANLYKAFASHYELPKKNFDKYHEPYKDKVDSSVNKCVVVETVDNVIPEAYIEKTPFPAKMKEYSVISSAVNKSEKKPKEPEEQIKIEPAVAIVKDLVTENVEDGHIIFCEDASNIVSHPNKSKQVSVPMLSVRIGDHCYYGLCDIGASVSAIPYELYTEIMHEIGSCELEDIDVVIHLANRETISPIGIVRDVEVLCGKIKYPADFLQHLENSESEAFRKERDELEEIFLRQPILKHDLPVEDLGTTPPPKEDPVFDLKPLPDNLKYAHIDDKKIYPVIISSKLSEIEEERLENIAYDPVPVNDSFPNEQLAVIKVSSRESPWICFGSRSIMSSSGTQKDSFFEDVVNPYMNELKMHPKELQLVDGELQIKDVQGPKGEGSLEDRMEKLEQEVFNYKKMAEREVDIFHKIVSELIDGHKKETAKLWDDIFSLHDTTNKLQAQLYDVHNQNCEYENRFKRISHAASFRFPETKMSFVDGGPLPWKSDDDKDSPSSPKE